MIPTSLPTCVRKRLVFIHYLCAFVTVYFNFARDGAHMTALFQYLTEAILCYDPNFFAYLREKEVSFLSVV